MSGIWKKVIKIPFKIIDDLLLFFITYIPSSTGRKLRYLYWRSRFKKCGKNVVIDEGVIIQNPEWISIGDNVWIDKFCTLLAGAPDKDKVSKVFYLKENKNYKYDRGELIIGNNVHIAPFCTIQALGGMFIGNNVGIASGSRIYSLSHHYKNPTDPDDKFDYKFTPMAPKEEQSLISSPVVIYDDCAIGLNSVVLPGTTIKKGTWVGVMCYFSGEAEEESIYTSMPAKFLKKKF